MLESTLKMINKKQEEKNMKKEKLYKSREDKMICGVCGGLAEYFDVDPTLVRIAAVLVCCSGYGFLAYIAAAIIMPEKVE